MTDFARQRIGIFGSTGSIGTQTVDVLRDNEERFVVAAMSARKSSEHFVEQVRTLRPERVIVQDREQASKLDGCFEHSCEITFGEDALLEAAAGVDVAVNAVVGFAGLPVTLGALQAGKRLALANKESLIAAATVVLKAQEQGGGEIVPVDSEHCAIHQCLQGDARELSRIVLTASGGPFRGRSRESLKDVGIEETLRHPTWSMGPKITVDSSTLINKGLEVIEACALFGVPVDLIDVVVHPQSIVHSMVSFVDGSTIAQLSHPNMRLPIAYALGFPEGLGGAYGALDFTQALDLHFEIPDRITFRGLDLAYEAGRLGGVAPAWLSAANEVAVEAFLQGNLQWLEIAEVVEETLGRYRADKGESLGAVLEADSYARDVSSRVIRGKIQG